MLTSTDLTADVTVTASGALKRTARTDGRTTTTAYTPATGFPTSAKVTSPPAKTGDAATAQTTTTTRDVLRGLPLSQTDTNGKVRAGSLPAASMAYTYEDATLRPVTVDGSQGVTSSTLYSLTGKPQQYELSSGGGKKTWATNTYEWGTQRLATARVDRQDVAGVDQHSTYRYDQMGNVLSIADGSRSGIDNQCFTYDYLRRLTEAWTQGGKECASTPSGGVLGGPAAYWSSYTYDKVGNRSTETLHDPSGDPAKNTKRTYGYPAPGSPQPHTLTSVKATGPSGTAEDTFGYDESGNTTTRRLAGDTQSLQWDPEGRLSKVTEPVEGGADKVTEYLYDADGNRLIGRTPTETTLYLGATEITLPKGSSTPKATRYIDLGGGHQAVQQDDGSVSITLADHHGTGQLAVDAASQKLTQRRTLPFGELRGEEPKAWPGTKGFVGGTDDTKATGLTHLGAREYDPTTGRFLSVDSVMDLTDPQQINGYAYANNNPVTGSDPSGLFCDGCSADGDNNRWTASHGPGCTTEGCYDTGGRLYPQSHSPSRSWSGSGSSYRPGRTISITQKKGELWLEGIRIPAARELAIRFPGYESKEQLQRWAQGKCDSGVQGTKGFCSAAEAIGLVNYEQTAFEKAVTAVAISLVAPDADAWKSCLSGKSAKACGTAALDLPWARAFKGLKVLKACNSFTPDTEVLMADGTTKPIEDVEIGDKVIATDPKTGKTTIKTVTAEIKGKGLKHLVRLTLDLDGDKGSRTASVTATDGHPFWVPELHAWIDASDLRTGQWLRTSAGTRVEITAVKKWAQQATVRNLTVSDVHTYYVLAGETPVLVHNSNGICGSADAHSFRRTEALSGNASKRNVDSLTASMKENGWQGDPISVAKIGDDLYVLDGHHRIAAAKRAGIGVPYRVLSDADIRARYPGSADDITTAWAEVGPDRLVNKYKRPGYR